MGLSTVKKAVAPEGSQTDKQNKSQPSGRATPLPQKLAAEKEAKALAAVLEQKTLTLESFLEEHQEIFERHQEMLEAVNVATDQLKEKARQTDGFETRAFTIHVDHKNKHMFDDALFVKKVPNADKFTGLIHPQVDQAVLKALVKAQQIDPKIVIQCSSKVPMTSAVIIKRKA